jgi:hypothetical protein
MLYTVPFDETRDWTDTGSVLTKPSVGGCVPNTAESCTKVFQTS